jgi:hypothetical protein
LQRIKNKGGALGSENKQRMIDNVVSSGANQDRAPQREAARKAEIFKESLPLKIDFAKKAVELAGIPLEQALFEYTDLYRRFGLKGKRDAHNQVWQDFLIAIRDSSDLEKGICAFQERRQQEVAETRKEEKERPYGCFSYDPMNQHGEIQMHFSNIEKESGTSPLSPERKSERLAELTKMFKDIKDKYPEAKWVVGESWIKGLKAYQSLFPVQANQAPFLEQGEVHLQSGASWGQFMGRNSKVRANEFARRVAEAKNIDDLKNAFPLKAMRLKAPIELFYNFYGI